MVTQTLILSKTKFKTLKAASAWVKDHGFKVRHKGKAPDETGSSFRFRQRDPGDFQAGTFRTIKVTDGVSMVVGRLKTKKATTGTVSGVDINSTRQASGQGEPARPQGLVSTAGDLLDLIP
jgi:hypothetical protein